MVRFYQSYFFCIGINKPHNAENHAKNHAKKSQNKSDGEILGY